MVQCLNPQAPRFVKSRAAPAPGDQPDPRELALLAVEWIWMNRYYIEDQVPAEDGFDHREVISLMMYRASTGRGLARSLRKHVDGTDPIQHPEGLLLRYVYWAIGECRGKAAVRRERATDWTAVTGPAVPRTEDAEDNPHGFLRLIEILAQDCEQDLADAQPDLQRAVRHVTDRLADLWAIFCRCAPEQVSAEVASITEEDRACVLLAIFPVQLPHRAVATYLQMASNTNGGRKTVGGTQRKISRLRNHLRRYGRRS